MSSRRSRCLKLSTTSLTTVPIVMLSVLMMMERKVDPVDRARQPPAEDIRQREIRLHLHQGEQAVLDSTWMKGHRSAVILARSVHQQTILSAEDVVVAPAMVTG